MVKTPHSHHPLTFWKSASAGESETPLPGLRRALSEVGQVETPVERAGDLKNLLVSLEEKNQRFLLVTSESFYW